MPLRIEPIPSHETMFLLPMFLEAEEGEERIRAVLLDPACTAYACWLDGQLVGAAVVLWEEKGPGEIIYIEVAAALRGQGYGRQIIQSIQGELPGHGARSLLVGTANSSLENIAFYQKCLTIPGGSHSILYLNVIEIVTPNLEHAESTFLIEGNIWERSVRCPKQERMPSMLAQFLL